jgi:hypothetical protein
MRSNLSTPDLNVYVDLFAGMDISDKSQYYLRIKSSINELGLDLVVSSEEFVSVCTVKKHAQPSAYMCRFEHWIGGQVKLCRFLMILSSSFQSD